MSAVVVGGIGGLGCQSDETLGDVPDGGSPKSDAETHSTGESSSSASTGSNTDAGSGSGGTVVLFGGQDSNGFVGDTWTWDGAAWTQQMATGPSARGFSTGAALDGTVVLFGGEDDSGDLGDTWTWSQSQWTKETGAAPSARQGAVAATLGSSVLLFGGDDLSETDTWTWDGSTWKSLNVDGPDIDDGWNATPFKSSILLIGNGGMYAWNGHSWNNGMAVNGPSNTGGASVATLGNTVVLFGGGDPNSFASLNETWTWDGSNWTIHNVSGPSARSNAGMATVNGQVVLFGGCTYGFAADTDAGPSCMNDTWTWDGAKWTEQHVPGPSARAPAIMVTE